MKPYIGLKEKATPTIFESEIMPNKETHPQYDIIYGPFKNREDAEKYVRAMGCGVACGEGQFQLTTNHTSDGHVRIRDWAEYKRLVREKKPQSITFILEQNALSPNRELTTLRIIMLHDKRYFMFFDFPKDGFLKETGIPLHKDKRGLYNLDEDEVRTILKREFEKDKIEIFSFWTT